MYNEDEEDHNDFDTEESLDKRLAEETPQVPEDLKFSIEVGLTQYLPQGLMEYIARGLLTQIGGRDQWKKRLESSLLRLAKDKAGSLVTEMHLKRLKLNGGSRQLRLSRRLYRKLLLLGWQKHCRYQES